jgi:hypothetical protein
MKGTDWMVLGVVLAGLLPGRVTAQTGEFRVNGGLAAGLGSGGFPSSPFVSASFSFVKSAFSFGPEAGYAFGSDRIFAIGAVARLRVSSGRLRPYLVGGLGGNYWHRVNFGSAGLFSGSLGAGVILAERSPAGLTLEVRMHQNLQRYGGAENWDFITVGGGIRFGW